jgi:hypothetical protein
MDIPVLRRNSSGMEFGSVISFRMLCLAFNLRTTTWHLVDATTASFSVTYVASMELAYTDRKCNELVNMPLGIVGTDMLTFADNFHHASPK